MGKPLRQTASAFFAKQDGGTVRTKSCVFCNEEHDEINCSKVSNKEERKKLVFKFGRCLNCLKKGHRAFQCHSRALFRNCNQKHHISICESTMSPMPSAPLPPDNTANNANTTSCVGSIDSGGRAVLQTALAVVKVQVKDVKARVLFDTGSHRTFVTQGMVELLGIEPIKQERLGTKTFGSQKVDDRMRDVVEVELESVKASMESMADAHPRFLVDWLLAHLSDLRQNNRAGSVWGRVKICNFELPFP